MYAGYVLLVAQATASFVSESIASLSFHQFCPNNAKQTFSIMYSSITTSKLDEQWVTSGEKPC